MNPKFSSAYYNKAYCHAAEGNPDLAIESLKQAIHLYPRFQAIVTTDPDFEALRHNEHFKQLIKD